MSTIPTADEASFFKEVQGDKYGRSAADRGIVPGSTVTLYSWNEVSETAFRIGLARTMVQAGDSTKFQPTFHGHDVAEHMVVCSKPVIKPVLHSRAYPYTFLTTDDVPETLADLTVPGTMSVWDVREMRSVKDAVTDGPPPTTTNVDSGDTLLVQEIDMDEEDRKGVSFQPKVFSLPDYKTITIRAQINQIRDFDHPLRPIDEAHQEDLYTTFTDSSVGYQETAGIMSVTVTKEDSSDDDIPLSLLTKGNGDVYMRQEGRTCTIVDERHSRGAILKSLEVGEGET